MAARKHLFMCSPARVLQILRFRRLVPALMLGVFVHKAVSGFSSNNLGCHSCCCAGNYRTDPHSSTLKTGNTVST